MPSAAVSAARIKDLIDDATARALELCRDVSATGAVTSYANISLHVEKTSLLTRRDALVEAWCIVTGKAWPGPEVDFTLDSERDIALSQGVVFATGRFHTAKCHHVEGATGTVRTSVTWRLLVSEIGEHNRSLVCGHCKPEVPGEYATRMRARKEAGYRAELARLDSAIEQMRTEVRERPEAVRHIWTEQLVKAVTRHGELLRLLGEEEADDGVEKAAHGRSGDEPSASQR